MKKKINNCDCVLFMTRTFDLLLLLLFLLNRWRCSLYRWLRQWFNVRLPFLCVEVAWMLWTDVVEEMIAFYHDGVVAGCLRWWNCHFCTIRNGHIDRTECGYHLTDTAAFMLFTCNEKEFIILLLGFNSITIRKKNLLRNKFWKKERRLNSNSLTRCAAAILAAILFFIISAH